MAKGNRIGKTTPTEAQGELVGALELLGPGEYVYPFVRAHAQSVYGVLRGPTTWRQALRALADDGVVMVRAQAGSPGEWLRLSKWG